jgi:branched-chain amino acid aminotransferase
MWIYLHDKFVKDSEAVISVFDHGFLYGDGVYETIRSYQDKIFMLDQHIARLYRSADAIGLTIPVPLPQWPALLHEAMSLNQVGNAQSDAHLRITISRGIGDIGLDPALCPVPTLVIMTKPLVAPDSQVYEQGITLIIAKTKRNLPGALSPHIKSTNFLNNIMAKREAIAAGAFDSVLLNWENKITECTVSNLFFAQGGQLKTPSLGCGILDGVTRDIVIQLAREQCMAVEEGQYTAHDLRRADECFLTNTSMEIMPVASMDGHPIGSGKPGPITRQLRSLFGQARSRFLE